MATLRMVNGADVSVKLSVPEAIDAIKITDQMEFVELPGEDGPIHIRPKSVIAVIEDAKKNTAGFRFGATSAS
jgi:hypothetical protein